MSGTAPSQSHVEQSYQDNRAVLQYELVRRRLQVAETLMKRAPHPIVIRGDGGDTSALTTLITARLLPKLTETADGAAGVQNDC